MNRRGFSLIEILFAVSLLGVFLLIASRLVTANFHAQNETLQADGNTARFDRAVIALRRDVTNSKSVEMSDPTLLRIHTTDNQTIDWRIEHQSLSRIASDKRTWNIGQSLTFKLDGSVVLLSDGRDEIAMAGGTR